MNLRVQDHDNNDVDHKAPTTLAGQGKSAGIIAALDGALVRADAGDARRRLAARISSRTFRTSSRKSCRAPLPPRPLRKPCSRSWERGPRSEQSFLFTVVV